MVTGQWHNNDSNATSDVYSSLNISKNISVLKTGTNWKGNKNNKSDVCILCDSFSTNIARNESLKHKNEPEIDKSLHPFDIQF